MVTRHVPIRRLNGLSALFSSLVAMSRKEFIIMRRYPVEFLASFGQVFAIVAIFTLAALMFSGSPGEFAEGTGGGVVIYGFILFLFLSDTLWTIGYNIRREQKQGTLEALYLSPASKFASLVSRVTNTLFWTSLLVLAGVWLMSTMLGRLPFANPALAAFILVFALTGIFGVGFAFAAITLRIKEAGQTLANVMQFIFLILSAYFFPFKALPEGLLTISRFVPLSYAVDAFRSTLMGYPPGFPELAPIEIEIAITVLFGLLMPVLGYLWYRNSETKVRKNGSLSEY
jgi:ABC-2 type transport system permease protein